VGAGADWALVSCGRYHTVALKTDGSLWAWGDNGFGQLGQGEGSAAELHSPIQVGTDTDWVAVDTGEYSVVALKADGSLWAWGGNRYGQLGLGDSGLGTERYCPAQVGTDRDWATASVGVYHTAALKGDGSLWTWGSNGLGQLGYGSNIPLWESPWQVGADTDWASAEAGGYFTAALKDYGAIYAWGDNADGQLGDGTTVAKSVPARAGTAEDWVALAVTGGTHAAAMKANGALWTWGRNGFGQLGDGTTSNSSVPVLVGAGFRVP
jgi:alpha-tubulin suppressor-like RCC1 family protein